MGRILGSAQFFPDLKKSIRVVVVAVNVLKQAAKLSKGNVVHSPVFFNALPGTGMQLHMHTLCEQDFDPLERTWDVAFDHLEPWFGQFNWINLGGGHHITRADYQREELVRFLADVADDTGAQVYLEPGEAVALDAGILVGTVLDVHWNGLPVAITDISATCHMPDVIEAPYRPAMLGELVDEFGSPREAGTSGSPALRPRRHPPSRGHRETWSASAAPRASPAT